MVKIMTTEEKAKAYDEVVNKLAHFMEQGVDPLITRADVKDFFTELKESEDERIRKELVNYFTEGREFLSLCSFGRDKILAWLEKQGEQKPTDTDNKFIRMRETKPKDISEFLDRLTTVEQEFLWEHIAKIRELDKEKQKTTWSEEDEEQVSIITNIVKAHCGKLIDCRSNLSWLQSLKDRVEPKNRWKPNNEQIIALRWVLNNIPYNTHKEEISGLLEQIKDL